MNKLEELQKVANDLLAEIEKLKKEEFEYPLFKRNKYLGVIVKFTSLRKGTVVFKGDYSQDAGVIANWIEHTDEDIWEDVAYNKERGLYDGQPVWCWYIVDTHVKTLMFYDAINDCAFTYDGRRDGATTNYKPYEYEVEHINEWLIEASKTLKR